MNWRSSLSKLILTYFDTLQSSELRVKEGFNFWRDTWNGIYFGDNYMNMNGYLTDIQWFGRALSQQELLDITTCKSFMTGNIHLEQYKS